MFVDSIFIIFISVCTALFSEGLTWLLVYRTEKYQGLKADVERQCKKIEKKKESTDMSDLKSKKKLEKEEERLKTTNREISMVKMKSLFFIGITFTALLSMFSTIFEGRVVAHLPFTPLSYVQSLSHRNLLGDDLTDCSFIFYYILVTACVRQNIQKGLGFAPSRAASKHGPGIFTPQQNASGKLF